MFTAGATIAFLITGIYWTLLAPNAPAEINLNPIVFHQHAINSVLFLIDIFMVAFPTRFLHVIYPIGFGVVYILFALILHFAGVNSSIYPFLNFASNPGLAVGMIFLCGFVLIPVLHFVKFLFYHLRSLIAKSTTHNAQHYQPMNITEEL